MRHGGEWFFPAGDLSRDDWDAVVDASIPGWRHTGLRVGTLYPGRRLALNAGDVERIVVPVAGSFHVELRERSAAGAEVDLTGRRSVFDGPTDVLYVGAGGGAVITGAGRVAVAEAPTTTQKPTRYLSRGEVPVELRGAGRSSRQIHNFGTPQALDAAKLIVCEVITPAENWSSYPPHKHDEHRPGEESRLEEIYYFESAVTRGAQAAGTADPFGMFSTYSSTAGEIHTDSQVRTGDIALVPYGFHGPAVAAPGYDLYYLNVMAGPDEERAWNITDDPAHGWIRRTWDGQDPDPRLPYTPVIEGDRP
jgi:5-deoxy-glucuronate isomerase